MGLIYKASYHKGGYAANYKHDITKVSTVARNTNFAFDLPTATVYNVSQTRKIY